MALPYPSKVFTPFDQLPASDLNEMVANDEALAAGTGLDDGAVTPIKRAGGFFIGVIPAATLSTTGNKAITGVGFTPKLVKFTLIPSGSTAESSAGSGAMTELSQFGTAINISSSTRARQSTTSSILLKMSSAGASELVLSYVSMDADGFTVNVTTATSISVAYEAYA